MVADRLGGHVIANALEGVVIEDIVDTQQSAQIAERAAVPVSAPAETVGKSTLHLAVGIRRRRIVEVARQNHRIGRRIRLGADFTHLRGTNPAVAVHGAEHRIDRGFPVVVLLEAAAQLKERLVNAGFRVKVDDSDNSMGWKCAEYEMKGVPLRVECGPRDLENGQCILVRRNDGEKTVIKLEELEQAVEAQLELVQKGMYEKAKKNLEEHIYEAHSIEEAKELQQKNGGFIKTMWCGDEACELKMKEVAGMSSRCMPLKQEHLGDTCACCGKPAKHMIYWGVAY